jgi:hypothetical protein
MEENQGRATYGGTLSGEQDTDSGAASGEKKGNEP